MVFLMGIFRRISWVKLPSILQELDTRRESSIGRLRSISWLSSLYNNYRVYERYYVYLDGVLMGL